MASGGKHFKPSGTPSSTDPRSPVVPARTASETRDGGLHAASPARYNRVPSRKGGGPARGRRRDIVARAFMAVGVILLVVAVGLFVRAQLGYRQAAEFYEGLNKDVLKVDDSSGDGVPTIDFDALKKVNEDVVGWIYIPGTNVNYVVAQGETNETYLRNLISGEYNANGTVFMDMDDTAPGLVDQQTTLYGHHMNDGSMFSAVHATLDQAEFDKIEKVYYITSDATYELKPLFTMKVEDDYVDARRANFESDDAFRQYLKLSFGHSEAQSEDASEDIAETSKVLTLVTCDDAFLAKTKRVAMVCSLVAEVG